MEHHILAILRVHVTFLWADGLVSENVTRSLKGCVNK